MRFLGKDEEINVNTKKPEFFKWKWIKPNELTKVVVNFKLDVYKKLTKELTYLNLMI